MVEKNTVNRGAARSKREAKNRGFYMRMSASELEALDLLSYECDETKTEIMRKAFKTYYELMKTKL